MTSKHVNNRRSTKSTQPTVPMPKVVVVVPSLDFVAANFAMSLAAMLYMSRNIPMALINTKGSLITDNRNNGVDQAINMGATHIMFLDSDMSFPADTVGRLLNHDVDIVGGTYVKRIPPHPLLGEPLDEAPEQQKAIEEVKRMPTGCLMVKASVFKRMSHPYFRFGYVDGEEGKPGRTLGEDYYFCDKARQLGIKIHCDMALSMELVHWGEMGFRVGPNGDEVQTVHCGNAA